MGMEVPALGLHLGQEAGASAGILLGLTLTRTPVSGMGEMGSPQLAQEGQWRRLKSLRWRERRWRR